MNSRDAGVHLVCDALSFVLPEPWPTRPITSRGGIEMTEIAIDDDRSLLVLPAPRPVVRDRELPHVLAELIDGHILGRHVVLREPPEPALGVTRGGLPFATQQCVSRSPFGDVWFTTYWTLSLGHAGTQSLLGLASNHTAFVALLDLIGPVVDGLTLVEPRPNPTRTP